MQLCLEYPRFIKLEQPKQKASKKSNPAPTVKTVLSKLYPDADRLTQPINDKKLLRLYRILDMGA